MKHLSLQQVFEYIDNTSDHAELRRITIHLRDCPACRREVELHSELTKTLERFPSIAPSPDFTYKIMNEVMNTPLPKVKSKAFKFIRVRWIVAASMIVGISIFISSIPQQHQPPAAEPSNISSIVHTYSELLMNAGHSITDIFMKIVTILPVRNLSSFLMLLCAVGLLWIADNVARKQFSNIR